MAKVTMLHFPNSVLEPVLGPYCRRIFGHALFDLRRFLIFARRSSRSARERHMLHVFRFEILVFHQLNSSVDQNFFDFSGCRGVLFDPKGGGAFFDRLSCQLYEIEFFPRIHLNNVDPFGHVAELRVATKAKQALPIRHNRYDFKAQPQELFHRYEADAVWVCADAGDRYAAAVLKNCLALPSEQINPATQIPFPVPMDLLSSSLARRASYVDFHVGHESLLSPQSASLQIPGFQPVG